MSDIPDDPGGGVEFVAWLMDVVFWLLVVGVTGVGAWMIFG